MTVFKFVPFLVTRQVLRFDGLRLVRGTSYLSTTSAERMRRVKRFDARLDHQHGAIALTPNNTSGLISLAHNNPTPAHKHPRASFATTGLSNVMPLGRYYYKGKQADSYVFVHESHINWNTFQQEE